MIEILSGPQSLKYLLSGALEKKFSDYFFSLWVVHGMNQNFHRKTSNWWQQFQTVLHVSSAFLLNSDLAVELWEHIFVGDMWTWLIKHCLVWLDSVVRGQKSFWPVWYLMEQFWRMLKPVPGPSLCLAYPRQLRVNPGIYLLEQDL